MAFWAESLCSGHPYLPIDTPDMELLVVIYGWPIQICKPIQIEDSHHVVQMPQSFNRRFMVVRSFSISLFSTPIDLVSHPDPPPHP